jgi:hypothetical protein
VLYTAKKYSLIEFEPQAVRAYAWRAAHWLPSRVWNSFGRSQPNTFLETAKLLAETKREPTTKAQVFYDKN